MNIHLYQQGEYYFKIHLAYYSEETWGYKCLVTTYFGICLNELSVLATLTILTCLSAQGDGSLMWHRVKPTKYAKVYVKSERLQLMCPRYVLACHPTHMAPTCDRGFVDWL